MVVWRSDMGVGRINEVALRRARLVLGWVTGQEYTIFVCITTTLVHSAFYPLRLRGSRSALWLERSRSTLALVMRLTYFVLYPPNGLN